MKILGDELAEGFDGEVHLAGCGCAKGINSEFVDVLDGVSDCLFVAIKSESLDEKFAEISDRKIFRGGDRTASGLLLQFRQIINRGLDSLREIVDGVLAATYRRAEFQAVIFQGRAFRHHDGNSMNHCFDDHPGTPQRVFLPVWQKR